MTTPDYTLTPAADLKPGDEIEIVAKATVKLRARDGLKLYFAHPGDIHWVNDAEMTSWVIRRARKPEPVTLAEAMDLLHSVQAGGDLHHTYDTRIEDLRKRYDAQQPPPEVPAGALIATAFAAPALSPSQRAALGPVAALLRTWATNQDNLDDTDRIDWSCDLTYAQAKAFLAEFQKRTDR